MKREFINHFKWTYKYICISFYISKYNKNQRRMLLAFFIF